MDYPYAALKYRVDPKRVYFVGHSNGGFMSHRMACDRTELIAGIVALSGNVWADPTRCNPTGPVHILQVHGTLDPIIRYMGGSAKAGTPPYPSAETSVGTWGAKNGCTGTMLTPIGGNLDLVTDLLGAETERESFTGCPNGAAAELWRIRGAGHLPNFNGDWANTIYTWLSAHPKP